MASEYIRELVRRDQKERAEARLEALLLEGLESGGEDIPATPEFREGLRGKLAARRELRRKAR
jgi:antitoxin ParD1/3/4